MTSVMYAIGWEPELRGILTVLIGFVVWMGSIYAILATNLGARLAAGVALAGLFGWFALMALVWWMFGIGYKGPDASWDAVAGRTVIQQVDLLDDAGVVDRPIDIPDGDTPAQASTIAGEVITSDGWLAVPSSDPAFGQAVTSATTFLIEEGAFAGGDFAVTNMYQTPPPEETAYPRIGSFDLFAFWHKPYYALIEVAPYTPVLTEPGRAPVAPEINPEGQRQYVYMIRNLGSVREPAALMCIGSTIIFLVLVWMLNRRDRFAAENLSRKAIAAA